VNVRRGEGVKEEVRVRLESILSMQLFRKIEIHSSKESNTVKYNISIWNKTWPGRIEYYHYYYNYYNYKLNKLSSVQFSSVQHSAVQYGTVNYTT
jgi:hypothetical protein